NLPAIEEGEGLQIAHDVAVLDVQPELVEAEGRGARRIQPYGARFGLAELRARRCLHQRPHETVRLLAAELANQVDAGRDVAPLVASSHLNGASEAIEHLQEVVRLKDQITELGERNAFLALESAVHRLLLEHVIDGEIFAGVPQKRD